MKYFHKVEIQEKHLHKIECDSCHEIRSNKNDKDRWEFQEFLIIRISGEYGSIFGDGSIWECDLCQKCVKEILGKYLREVARF